MENFYLRLAQGHTVAHSQAAVILSLFALSAFFYPSSGSSDIGTDNGGTMDLCQYWTRRALDVLDHLRRDTSGTLEEVQAYILMSYVAYHLDGFSTRGRLFSTIAASLARDIGLQWLDHEKPLKNQDAQSLINQEVKRRVFWHIASTDW
jgi:hypothetical protein